MKNLYIPIIFLIFILFFAASPTPKTTSVVHFALIQPSDRSTIGFTAGCDQFKLYVNESRAYFNSQGVDFIPDVRCIISTHSYAEIGQPDACGEGLNATKVISLVLQQELGWDMPVRSKINERAAVSVEGGGGYAGTLVVQSGTQNVGISVTGDWGLITDVTGVADPCAPDWGGYGGFRTLCHELLHAFRVNADAVPAQFCTENLDAARLRQLKSQVNRLWLQ